MNPMLLQLLQRFGPRAAGMLQNGFGTRVGMIQTPEPELQELAGVPQGPPPVAPPISGPQTFSPPTPPPPPFGGSFNAFDPQPTMPPMASSAPPQAPPALSPQAMALPPAAAPAVTMPMPRPPEAPQSMGFFERNAAMMQDPNNPGSFIDPINAQRATGPDVINKFLQMFKDKA